MLKTLKDIDFRECGRFVSDGLVREGLREEAINWINRFRSGDAWTDFAADGRKGQENIEEWIQHFFNISKGDLR